MIIFILETFESSPGLPIIPVQDLYYYYYYRQLTVNTFGTHDIKSGKMTCFVHHEGGGETKANYICSHLNHYIDLFVHSEIKRILIFTDNCTGQNKN